MDRTQTALVALALLAAPALAGCIGADDPAPSGAADDGSGDDPAAEAADDGTEDNATSDEPVEWQTVERTVVAKDVLPEDGPRNYSYDPARIEVPVNSTVELTLESHPQNVLDHDIRIEGQGVDTETIGPGESLTVTFDVTEPGPSPYWCTVGDHRDRGMEGVLVVTAG